MLSVGWEVHSERKHFAKSAVLGEKDFAIPAYFGRKDFAKIANIVPIY